MIMTQAAVSKRGDRLTVIQCDGDVLCGLLTLSCFTRPFL